jgi:glutaredoxin
MTFIKQPQSITLYCRPICGWCQDAKAWLDAHGQKYTVLNTTDPATRLKAVELSRQTYVPVIEIDGLVLGDFDTNQLEAFLKNNGYLA